MQAERVLLEDRHHTVTLNINYPEDRAPGFLLRRCFVSDTTPGGELCVGSFDRLPDGRWQASISRPYDSHNDSDAEVVGAWESRMDAIVALWASRSRAYSGDAA